MALPHSNYDHIDEGFVDVFPILVDVYVCEDCEAILPFAKCNHECPAGEEDEGICTRLGLSAFVHMVKRMLSSGFYKSVVHWTNCQ